VYYHPTILPLNAAPVVSATGEAGRSHSGDAEITLRARRLVFENTVFPVYTDHIADKNGGEVQDCLVVTPKRQSGDLISGVAILSVMDGQVGLICIYRHAIRDWSWEIPHGFVEDGEEPLISAFRELAEETGIQAESVSSLGCITPDSGILAARVHIFLATGCCIAVNAEGEMGLREFEFFPLAKFEEMIRNSVVQDAFTLVAWCRYRMLTVPEQIC
jgi:ADP-ribose pyrophosphatase